MADTLTQDDGKWIGGDGGPLIVLQASAVSQWQGAADFNNSLMSGGSVETDYDVICQAGDYVIRHRDRDMLVLDDSEWSGQMLLLPSGGVAVVQGYSGSNGFADILARAAQAEPEQSSSFVVEDDALRLLVGADDGEGGLYGFVDVPVTSGIKRCDFHRSDDYLVVILSAADGEQHHDG